MAAVTDLFGITLDVAGEKETIDQYFLSVLEYKPFSDWAKVLVRNAQTPLLLALQLDYVLSSGGDGAELLQRKEKMLVDGGTCETPAHERGLKYLKALDYWKAGDLAKGYQEFVSVTLKHPSDLFAAKRAQLFGLILGNASHIYGASLKCSDWAESILKESAEVLESDPRKYYFGMHAFSLEQIGDWRRAETEALKGLDFFQKQGWEVDPWLLHSCVHVAHNAMDFTQAIRYLEQHVEKFSIDTMHCFLYTHFWWHLAISYIEKALEDVSGLAAILKSPIGTPLKSPSPNGAMREVTAEEEKISLTDALKKTQTIVEERLWDVYYNAKNYGFCKDPQVQLNCLGVLWRLKKYAGKDTDAIGRKADANRNVGANANHDANGNTYGSDATPNKGVSVAYCSERFEQLKNHFTPHLDPLLDVLYLGMLESSEERRNFEGKMRENATRDQLTIVANIATTVNDILDAELEVEVEGEAMLAAQEVAAQVKAEEGKIELNIESTNQPIDEGESLAYKLARDRLQDARERLYMLDWTSLGNSWEQRMVLEVLQKD